MDAGDSSSMAQGNSSSSSSSSEVEWSSLPGELLAIVCSKLASPHGRIRFAAVCSSWRAVVLQEPAPPALPLLLLSPSDRAAERRLYCPEDGAILSVPVPSGLMQNTGELNGSYHGGWVVAGGRNRIAIANLFSGAEVPLSQKQRRIWCTRHNHGPTLVLKIIFSEPPTSRGCILAAMTDRCNIALCRIGCPDGGWTVEGCERDKLEDIAFCRGELYGLTRCGENLLRYDIGQNIHGAPVVTAAHVVPIQRRNHGPICENKDDNDYAGYIFELRGKLAMAVMIRWLPNRRPFLKVFELAQADADDHAHDYKWVELHSLGDHTLFLGPAFSSRVLNMTAGGRRGGVEKNRIYYSHHRSVYVEHEKEFDKKVYLTKSVDPDRMYYFREEDQNDGSGSDDMEQFKTLGYCVTDGPFVPMWCFPPEF